MVGEIWGLFTHSLLKAIHFPPGFPVFHHFGPCKTIQILEEFQRTEFQSSLKRHKGKYTVSPFRKKLFPRNMRFSQGNQPFSKRNTNSIKQLDRFVVGKQIKLYWLTHYLWFNPSLNGIFFSTSLGRAKTSRRVGGDGNLRKGYIWEWKKRWGSCALLGF